MHWCVCACVCVCEYLCLPGVNLLANLLELSERVVFSGPQHTLQVIDAIGDSYCHLLTLRGCLGTLVQSGMESEVCEWKRIIVNKNE